MTEEQKQEKKFKKLQVTYNLYKENLGLTGDMVNDIHKLVEQAIATINEKNEKMDSIKDDDYNKACEIMELKKGVYMKFVRMSAQKLEGKLKSTQIDKFKDEINNTILNANISQVFLDSYIADKNMKIVVDAADPVIDPEDEKESNDFEKILEHSAQTLIYINTLNKRYKIYCDVAEYITGGKLVASDFKQLVDFEGTKEGGYPKPSTPAKLWALYKKFAEAYRSMNSYKFNQIDKLNDEFGLDITLKDEHKVNHKWTDYEESDETLDD